ncbi:histidinol-phosphatase [Treponema pectinovorum]|uniref:histidinol-phosphatase n=1 Tax=Treponema pectinovorum TaxID=164 RepID=UPI003D89CF4C
MTQTYIKTNFHTHSTFCDGKNTLEENVLSAIDKGIKILGFSSHSTWPVWIECNMKLEDFESYCQNINFLKSKYEQKIDIRLGFEADYIETVCRPDFLAYKKFSPDFLIGSVHFLYNGEKDFSKILAVDNTPQILMDFLKTTYNNDEKKLIHHYFEQERKMLSTCNFSIIGHADLIRKFNDKIHFFDETADWYKQELKETAKAISSAGVICEVNTGAISRNWLKTPYPSQYFLTLLHERNVPIMINSDAHQAQHLDFAFEEALALVKKVGYKELAYPENNSIKTFKI